MNTKVALVSPPKGGCTLYTHSEGATYHPDCDTFPLKLGRNVLEELRLYFAISQRRLYFTAANEKK